MIKWFKYKYQAQKFLDENKGGIFEQVFKDSRGKHKAKPFAASNRMIWINRN
jgi:hypothetical protein